MELKISLRVPKSPKMNPTLRQVYSVHIIISYLFKVPLYLCLPSLF